MLCSIVFTTPVHNLVQVEVGLKNVFIYFILFIYLLAQIKNSYNS